VNASYVTAFCKRFLRAIAECFMRFIHHLGVRLSVRPSIRHTLALYQNGAS